MEPVLIIMAAGMGSRYGGLKQMDPIDPYGNSILHYSVYDALKAGFKEIIFVIKEENEADFKRLVTSKLEGSCKCSYAFQKVTDIPEGFSVPEGRIKPWGTAHAVRACKDLIKGRPFTVINADDYYGSVAFQKIYDFLTTAKETFYAMVGYRLENTVTENGSVARGVCEVDDNGMLTNITERTRIQKTKEGIAFSEDQGETWTSLDPGTVVSMNFWGFTPSFMHEIDLRFTDFLKGLKEERQKVEYFLPSVVKDLIAEDKCSVRVLLSEDSWYGVTYKEDKPSVMTALQEKRERGEYYFSKEIVD